MTNTSAVAAIRTLRTVGANLNEAQKQVSSGLRVLSASDNAAYWSIATTMRSDQMASSAVTDSLGLGAAVSETAYSGTDAIIEVLDRFKSRLVAAREAGVDPGKIQSELEQLKAQAHSIVESSSFAGVNWLTTNSPKHLMETGKLSTSVVFSFDRLSNNAVSVRSADVNLKLTSMINSGGGGMLQKELYGVGDIGGFRSTGINSVAHQGHESHAFTGPATFSTSDYIDFDITVDAGAHSSGVTFSGLRIDKTAIDAALGTTDGKIATAANMRAVLKQVFDATGVPASAYETLFTGSAGSGFFEIGSTETSGHPGSSIDLSNVSSSFAGNTALGLESPPHANHDNMYPQASIGFTKPFTVTDQAAIYFDVRVGSGAIQTFTIDHNSVGAALGTSDGAVNDASELAAVIAQVSAGSGLDVTASGSQIKFAADQTIFPEAGNHAARVFVGNVRSVPPWALEFDLAEVDVTTSHFTVDDYITGVEYMLKRATNSASLLGALQARIDLQSGFLRARDDAVNRGVGKLLDADMNEVSARTSALKVQQQLAVQSLHIANQNSDNILQLYR